MLVLYSFSSEDGAVEMWCVAFTILFVIMMKRGYTYTKYTHPISGDDKLEVSLKFKRGKVVIFSIIYRKRIENRLRMVKRCDNAHGNLPPHCHIYKFGGGGHRELLPGEPGTIATEIINDLKENYQKIIDNFQFSK